MNRKREILRSLIESIMEDNVLTKKELKTKAAQILILNNDSRKLGSLIESLLNGEVDKIKDKDVESLINVFTPFRINNNKEPNTDLLGEKQETNHIQDDFNL